MTSSVRLATSADIADIAELSNWAAAHTTANFATEPEPQSEWRADFESTHERYPWIVAEDDEFLGFAKAAPWKGRCAYTWAAETTVYVRPEHHGKGVGRSLYAELIDRLRSQGFRTLLAGISLPNAASVGLHESFGFESAGVFRRIGFKFGAWHDVGYWQLALGESQLTPEPLGPVTG